MKKILKDSSSTFVDNMSLPIHRWFRYSAGFSSEWVENVIDEFINENSNNNITILDPFVGSGTTLLASDKLNLRSFGFESHPLVTRVANSKLMWETETAQFKTFFEMVLNTAREDTDVDYSYPEIVLKCYNDDNLIKLHRLVRSLKLHNDDSKPYWLTWLAFVTILRSSSHAGTATWQYVLPNKKKAKVMDAFEALNKQVELMCSDIEYMQSIVSESKAKLIQHDSREPYKELNDKIDLVITSPPYANNYDYADATRLELSVLGEIEKWGDLQTYVRPGLVRSCSQMVSKEKKDTFEYLKDPLLESIYSEILDVCKALDIEKELHGGKKNYHTMIALYFLDMAKVWRNLRSMCKNCAKVCFVIGDSAPYGVYVPVDEWLGKLALAAGFHEYTFEKTRDRNVKWENRKHRVPLKEGRLWVRG